MSKYWLQEFDMLSLLFGISHYYSELTISFFGTKNDKKINDDFQIYRTCSVSEVVLLTYTEKNRKRKLSSCTNHILLQNFNIDRVMTSCKATSEAIVLSCNLKQFQKFSSFPSSGNHRHISYICTSKGHH